MLTRLGDVVRIAPSDSVEQTRLGAFEGSFVVRVRQWVLAAACMCLLSSGTGYAEEVSQAGGRCDLTKCDCMEQHAAPITTPLTKGAETPPLIAVGAAAMSTVSKLCDAVSRSLAIAPVIGSITSKPCPAIRTDDPPPVAAEVAC